MVLGPARASGPPGTARAGTRSVTAEQLSCALSSMKIRACAGACIIWRRVVFLYQLPLSAYQMEQTNTVNIRIPQRCETGTRENPATVGIRSKSGRRRLRACPSTMGELELGIRLQRI